MLLEMGLIVAGIPAGWLLRRSTAAQGLVSFLLTWAVRLLLFLLGLSLGADALLLSRIRELGLQALVISGSGMLGCLAVAWCMGRLFRTLENKRTDPCAKPAPLLHEHEAKNSCKNSKQGSAALGPSPLPASSSSSSGPFPVAPSSVAPTGAIPSAGLWGLCARLLRRIPMKGSLLVLLFFFVGVLAGHYQWLPLALAQSNASLWTLYLLLFSAGMGVGFDLKALGIIRDLKGRIFLVPLGVVVGTLAGSSVGWLGLHMALPGNLSLPEALAVGAGFGYYSLATVIITNMGDPALGSVALLSNMIHELVALTLSPLIARFVGRLGPVMAGGAAAMDTCLPVIAKYSGERYAIVAVFSGVALTMLVPVLVPALMALR